MFLRDHSMLHLARQSNWKSVLRLLSSAVTRPKHIEIGIFGLDHAHI